MESLGLLLKEKRQERGLILRKVAAAVDIDQSLISKFEKNERIPTKKQIIRLADFYKINAKEIIIKWYSQKIYDVLEDQEDAMQILKVAEARIAYKSKQKQK
ncbi:MAG: helix-turn-helix domain-containing protein [Saprospiraceae bacterium]